MNKHWTNGNWWEDLEWEKHLSSRRKRLKREREGQMPLIQLDAKPMNKFPVTVEEARTLRYDVYDYNAGDSWIEDHCAYGIIDKWHHEHQCRVKSGHGPSGLYCRRHAVLVEKAINFKGAVL